MKKIYISIFAIIIIFILTVTQGEVFGVKNSSTTSKNQIESNSVTEQDLEKSNKYLKELSVEGYEIFPKFNKNTLNYYVIIKEDVTSLKINAEAEATGAIVRISGNTRLTKKENTITITVTAVDGTSRSYTIIASKEPEVNLKLTSLNVEGINLNPVFDQDIYYYTSSLEDTELNSLNITATSNDKEARIEILGNNNIKDGENLINIILTNEDETTVYQINLEVDKLGEKEKEAGNVITKIRQLMKYITIGIASLIGIIILSIIISIIVRKVRKNKHTKED